ncbi:uncharacterized protein B0I36DRAFT_362244 [Microdochium trichocladiopsis]|uniref:Thaumatin family-domain-containing protein n=1 Tax=Microdochium trichocladiopsis TaxID=1682393 RepID=A0A9P9BSC4_9PEZI|nr:uncharacterized protein B0I36DRAFT_362244 [Microdochium trichocladiopsis]KAH7033598.1 hypothetical protein B0I36DRAFT_362244 [Microdochium trichocladiopsis]
MTGTSFRSLASIIAVLSATSPLAVLAVPQAVSLPEVTSNSNIASPTTAAPAITTVPPNVGLAFTETNNNNGGGGGGENLIYPAQLSSHANKGALNIAAVTQNVVLAAAMAQPPQYLTIKIINRHPQPLSKTHARNWDSPTAVAGDMNPGIIGTKTKTRFVVPTGWAGMVALGEARYGTPQDASLIEASFVRWDFLGMAVAAVDVSYVDAFTVPIVCKCSKKVVTGCNKPLFGLSSCPNMSDYGACLNPTRPFPDGTTASPFFAPCRAAAYTFAKDDLATSCGDCQSGKIKCCVGKKCAPNPRQPARRDPTNAEEEEVVVEDEEEEDGDDEFDDGWEDEYDVDDDDDDDDDYDDIDGDRIEVEKRDKGKFDKDKAGYLLIREPYNIIVPSNMQAKLFKILAFAAAFSTVQSAPVETAGDQVTQVQVNGTQINETHVNEAHVDEARVDDVARLFSGPAADLQ